jgi:hypothetical protein
MLQKSVSTGGTSPSFVGRISFTNSTSLLTMSRMHFVCGVLMFVCMMHAHTHTHTHSTRTHTILRRREIHQGKIKVCGLWWQGYLRAQAHQAPMQGLARLLAPSFALCFSLSLSVNVHVHMCMYLQYLSYTITFISPRPFAHSHRNAEALRSANTSDKSPHARNARAPHCVHTVLIHTERKGEEPEIQSQSQCV